MSTALEIQAVDPIETVEIASINRDVQVRVRTDRGTVDDYARAMASGATFPPIVCFRDKKTGTVLVADGNHRLDARLKNGDATIEAEVREGGKREALAYAVGSSKGHGLRFGNADKRKAVTLALGDSKLKKMSDNALADLIGVSQPFVSKLRASLITVISAEPKTDAESVPGMSAPDDHEAALLAKLMKQVERLIAQCPETKRVDFWTKITALFESKNEAAENR
jgi:hypothetical protein